MWCSSHLICHSVHHAYMHMCKYWSFRSSSAAEGWAKWASLLVLISVYLVMTLTYYEHKHAQSKQHFGLVGVINRRDEQESMICSTDVWYWSFKSKENTVFSLFFMHLPAALIPKFWGLAILCQINSLTKDRRACALGMKTTYLWIGSFKAKFDSSSTLVHYYSSVLTFAYVILASSLGSSCTG